MRKPSIAVPIVRIRTEIYMSRTVTRSQTVRQLAVTRHRERYQKRWERNNVPKIVNAMIEGRRGDRSQGCPGPQGRIVVEDQARSVSQAGVTLASNACEFSMTSAVSAEARAPAPSAA